VEGTRVETARGGGGGRGLKVEGVSVEPALVGGGGKGSEEGGAKVEPTRGGGAGNELSLRAGGAGNERWPSAAPVRAVMGRCIAVSGLEVSEFVGGGGKGREAGGAKVEPT
jgi:hypothetical protein